MPGPPLETSQNLDQLQLIVEIRFEPEHHLIAGTDIIQPRVTLREVGNRRLLVRPPATG